jgi:Domain of unknown function (DUF4153)
VDPRIARRAAASALIAGIAADILFDRVALGINVPIATTALLLLVTWLSPRHRPADPLDWWLPAAAILASMGPALRTDPTVLPLDLLLCLAATIAWGVAVSGVPVTRRAAAGVIVLGGMAGGVCAVALAWLVARSGADGFFVRAFGQLGRLAPVARGALLALPVLGGFAVLLASADAVFGRALGDALRLPIDLGEAIERGTFSVLAAALVAGPIALAVGTPNVLAWVGLEAGAGSSDAPDAGGATEEDSRRGAPPTPRIGATEALVVLGAVDLLFAAFGVVQVVYLFGGRDTLAAIGMSYSDYARQGYFQLVAVVALAGILLLGAHAVAGRTRRFTLAALILLVLTGVILASAGLRLALYQGAYGWTELRFFVAASIAWLGICIGLAIVLLGTDRMRWLPHGIAISAVTVTLAISAIGPQAFIVRENLARVVDPGLVAPGGYAGFDTDYVLQLGDDTIPDLVAGLGYLPATDRAAVLARLQDRRQQLQLDESTASPLAWSLARERAREALSELPGR